MNGCMVDLYSWLGNGVFMHLLNLILIKEDMLYQYTYLIVNHEPPMLDYHQPSHHDKMLP